ncbi:hypothetical protein HK102_000031 [Quaeritorhiza haematococci]|nr:hypothetical protein HK102_000031 [Quaeritorhiza haematococci]
MTDKAPNASHHALDKLLSSKFLSGIVTQNVDGLHGRGSERLVELHGTLEALRGLNPDIIAVATEAKKLNPDGDTETLMDYSKFNYPDCPACGSGILKPSVVLFGENISAETKEAAFQMIDNAEALLVFGSSLQVYSAYRLVSRAHQEKKPIAILTMGPTRADALATVKIEAPLGEVLPAIVDALTQRSSMGTSTSKEARSSL